MTFGKCIWNGCTRHAEKSDTRACRGHHQVMRDSSCVKCGARPASRREAEERLCAKCRRNPADALIRVSAHS